MFGKIIASLILLSGFVLNGPCQEEYLKISADIQPKTIVQGEDGTLKIKITPREGIKISSHPEFMIKMYENSNLVFPKELFTASELNVQTKQENDLVLLDLENEVEIPFKLRDSSLIGRHTISGEIIFTAIFEDNWSLKTYQKFITRFSSRRNQQKSNNGSSR